MVILLNLWYSNDKKVRAMLIQILLLVIGFILLIKGADIFVDGASSIAGNFKISKKEGFILLTLFVVYYGYVILMG